MEIPERAETDFHPPALPGRVGGQIGFRTVARPENELELLPLRGGFIFTQF